MVFGYQIEWASIVYGGAAVFALIVFEMLVGLRKIKFKGRRHMKVHTWVAWALVVLAAVHGFMAAVIYNGWRLF